MTHAAIDNPLFSLFRLESSKKALVAELAILGLAVLLFLGLSLYYWGFFQDDAYVFMRYARNLLDGQGLVFNQNEHVEGFTEPLWALIITVGMALHLPAIGLMKILSMLFGLLALIALWLCARQQIDEPVLSAIPPLLFALNPSFVLWSQGGLGTTLIAFLLLIHFYFLLRYLDFSAQRDLTGATVSMVLAILSRPEAALYFAVSTFVMLIKTRRDGRWHDWIHFVVVSVAALISLYIFRLSYYGDFYPNTYYAKVSANLLQWLHGFKEFYKKLLTLDFNFILLAMPLLLLLRRTLTLGSIWLFCAVLVHTIYYLRIGTDLLPLNRLYQPVFGLLYLAFAEVLDSLILYARKYVKVIIPAAIAGVLCAAYAGDLIHSTLKLSSYRGMYACTENAHGYIGRWLEEHAKPGDKVAVTDVGATSYYAKDLYVIDLLGLTDHTVAHTLHDTGYYPWLDYLAIGDNEYAQKRKTFNEILAAYFAAERPRYMVVQVNVKPQDFNAMQQYVKQPPAHLDAFLLSHVAMEVVKQLFNDKAVLDAYRVVLVQQYDPYYAYFLLLEREDDKGVNGGPGQS